MPYANEYASKVSHVDIVQNPDVQRFLSGCTYLRAPSADEVKTVGARFSVPPSSDALDLPERVLAVDGSYHEASIDDRLPSTKVAYVKVSSIAIDMTEFRSLRSGRFIDPFRVASLERNSIPITFTLPSANIRWQGKASVRDGFRAAVDEQLAGPQTRFLKEDPHTSLRSTLFHLASRRPDEMGTGDPMRLKLHACPTCGEGPIELTDVADPQHCPHCAADVYPSDCLRLWEEVVDHQSNVEAVSRFMTLVEHLLTMHYLRFVAEQSLASLSALAFFIDGPLALFGNGAWVHASIMRYLAEVNGRLSALGKPGVVVVGLQKTGQVVDHAQLIARFVPENRISAIDDEYRYRYIATGRDPARAGFGSQTYYGQDFLYKTPSGRIFVFALPYPFSSKREPGLDFVRAKAELGRYGELGRALALIRNFESDLYTNAVVPIALAHRYTSISLEPGGRVLDLLTRRALRHE